MKKSNKEKLFKIIDDSFIKFGREIHKKGFYPQFSEVENEDIRITWYTDYNFEDGTHLITMYESITDLGLSTLLKNKEVIKSVLHTGVPKNIEEAKVLVDKLFKEV